MELLKYNPDPYNAPGEWLKCNLHAHSTGSDGALSPKELTALYRDRDYDVLCITDHNVLTDVQGLSDDTILVIPGEEMNPLSSPSDHGTFHIVGIGLQHDISNRELVPSLVIREIHAQGGVSFLGHPAWGGHHVDEMLGAGDYEGIEVFNMLSRKSAKGYSDQIWDQLIDLRGPVWGIAVDDVHGKKGAFGGWVYLKAKEKTQDAVLHALKAGQFYATQGPTIMKFNIELVTAQRKSGEKYPAWKVSAETSPVQLINVITNADWGRWAPASEETAITTTERVLSSHARWVRLDVMDENGCRAWSNPLMIPPSDSG